MTGRGARLESEEEEEEEEEAIRLAEAFKEGWKR